MTSDLTQIPSYGHFADVNGIRMYYEVHGEGPPLVVLHGYTDVARRWEPYVSEFAKHFQVIVPDQRGHGRSLDPTNQVTLLQMALDAVALLDQLGIERFKAIGDSAGACALQYIASQQPARVDALILAEGGSYFPEQTRVALTAWAKTDDAEFLREGKHHRHRHGISQLRALLDRLSPLMEDYAAQPPDLAAITARTLLVFGDRDNLYPLTVSADMYRALADVALWIVPNTDHGFLTNYPDKYVDILVPLALAFLQDRW